MACPQAGLLMVFTYYLSKNVLVCNIFFKKRDLFTPLE
jgi:hypothetical protein